MWMSQRDDWMIECVSISSHNKWMNVQMHERIKRTSRRNKWRLYEWRNGWTKQWVNDCVNERLSDVLNEWCCTWKGLLGYPEVGKPWWAWTDGGWEWQMEMSWNKWKWTKRNNYFVLMTFAKHDDPSWYITIHHFSSFFHFTYSGTLQSCATYTQ